MTYHNLQGAAYFQDDIRVRRGLTLVECVMACLIVSILIVAAMRAWRGGRRGIDIARVDGRNLFVTRIWKLNSQWRLSGTETQSL